MFGAFFGVRFIRGSVRLGARLRLEVAFAFVVDLVLMCSWSRVLGTAGSL